MPLDIQSIPFDWVRDELRLGQTTSRGDRGTTVQRVQEWLTLNGVAVVIDQQFGPATQYAVRRFQSYRDLPKTGAVDERTFTELTLPLQRALV